MRSSTAGIVSSASLVKLAYEPVVFGVKGTVAVDVNTEFPTAVFKIKSRESVPSRKGSVYRFKGDFTLHGQTQSLEFIAEQTKKNGRQILQGNFTILQSDFGITPYKAALGTVGVADELKIRGDIWIAAEETKR